MKIKYKNAILSQVLYIYYSVFEVGDKQELLFGHTFKIRLPPFLIKNMYVVNMNLIFLIFQFVDCFQSTNYM